MKIDSATETQEPVTVVEAQSELNGAGFKPRAKRQVIGDHENVHAHDREMKATIRNMLSNPKLLQNPNLLPAGIVDRLLKIEADTKNKFLKEDMKEWLNKSYLNEEDCVSLARLSQENIEKALRKKLLDNYINLASQLGEIPMDFKLNSLGLPYLDCYSLHFRKPKIDSIGLMIRPEVEFEALRRLVSFAHVIKSKHLLFDKVHLQAGARLGRIPPISILLRLFGKGGVEGILHMFNDFTSGDKFDPSK